MREGTTCTREGARVIGEGTLFGSRDRFLGPRLPKRNAGADVSGTYQAPWVRRRDDLDELPEGLPWGDTAREAQRAFKRRDDRKKASNA